MTGSYRDLLEEGVSELMTVAVEFRRNVGSDRRACLITPGRSATPPRGVLWIGPSNIAAPPRDCEIGHNPLT